MTMVELMSLLVLNFIAIVAMPFVMSRTHYKGRVKQCILDIFVLFVLLWCFVINASELSAML